jgi:hypothetical protein
MEAREGIAGEVIEMDGSIIMWRFFFFSISAENSAEVNPLVLASS